MISELHYDCDLYRACRLIHAELPYLWPINLYLSSKISIHIFTVSFAKLVIKYITGGVSCPFLSPFTCKRQKGTGQKETERDIRGQKGTKWA